MAHTNLGKAANSLLTAADINKLLAADGSGDFSITGNSLTVDNLIASDDITMGSGKGISFDPHAAGNVLDDYEEGTWTPELTCQTGSFTTLTHNSYTAGKYIKVGIT